jgi:hypothetical protein
MARKTRRDSKIHADFSVVKCARFGIDFEVIF